MTEEVLGNLINGLALLLVAVLGKMQLKGIKADVSETRKQTQNSHKTNLRDDIDRVSTDVTTVKGVVASIERTISHLTNWLKDLAEEDSNLEQTMDRKTMANARAIERNRDETMAYIEDMHRALLLRIDGLTPDDRKKP